MDEKLLFDLRPDFNFIYELGMPTGRRIRTPILALVFLLLAFILINYGIGAMGSEPVVKIFDSNVMAILNTILLALTVIDILYLIGVLIFQLMQYKNINYSFYEEHMEYEDNFLNKHKKKIQYENIREIELKRTIWDRINGVGLIVIYTNAENEYSNGLVIYSIRDSERIYKRIDETVHNKQRKDTANNYTWSLKNEDTNKTNLNVAEINNKNVEDTEVSDFKESLKK